MSEQQFPCVARFGELGCLACRGMTVLTRQSVIPLAIGGVVVKQINTLQQVNILHHRLGVGKVGITADKFRWSRQFSVWYHLTGGGSVVRTVFNTLYLREFDTIFRDAFRYNVPSTFLFAKQKAIAGHTMVQRYGSHIKMAIRENPGGNLTVNRIDAYFEISTRDEIVDLHLQDVRET